MVPSQWYGGGWLALDGGGGVAGRARQLFTQVLFRNSLIKDNLAYELQ